MDRTRTDDRPVELAPAAAGLVLVLTTGAVLDQRVGLGGLLDRSAQVDRTLAGSQFWALPLRTQALRCWYSLLSSVRSWSAGTDRMQSDGCW